MKNLSIKATMIAIFSSIAIACSVLGWTAWTSFESLNAATTQIAANWLPSVDTARQLESQVLRLRIAYPDPEAAVRNITTMLLGTADAVADKVGVGEFGHTSAGATEAMERVGTIAEKTVALMMSNGVGASAITFAPAAISMES